jgi:alkaline phosphatase
MAVTGLARTGNVIFLHPDGTGVQAWTALRMLDVGPDGFLNWDRLPYMANYRGHLSNALAATSNGGGSVHAYGVKASTAAFGQEGTVGMVSASGKPYSIMVEAKKAGMAIGIVTSATVADAGTGVFLARTDTRRNYTEIARQMLSHKPEVLLGGGEAYFLPKGTQGRHGEGIRTDGRNLIQEAEAMGYTVVYTKDELSRAAKKAKRILGLFAHEDTFNDESEEKLREQKRPLFVPTAARFDQMTDAAIQILERSGRQFLLVAEEEGTDNFAGDQNARGVLNSLRGADRAVGIARAFQRRKPNTLVLVASDSNCGGMAVVGETAEDTPMEKPLPERDSETGSAIDGRDGTATPPFWSAPDAEGRRFPFGIAWAGGGDMAAGVVAKAQGLNANLLGTNVSNRGMYRLMYRTLFGRWPESKRQGK